MFTIDNKKIGEYLGKLIKDNGYNDRQFCMEYLKQRDKNFNPDAIQNMQNRICQIKKGKKGVQIEDLPIFSDILGVTIEEILSAGNYFIPDAFRITNYSVAFSTDQQVWEKYIHDEEGIFLNYDEYGKSIIDYALEFKNYKLLKYLMGKEYIWFIDENESRNFFYCFGAGTSIKHRRCTDVYSWEYAIKEKDKLRTDMVSLAIENHDYDLMDELHARETPELYHPITYTPNNVDKDFSNDRLIDCVVHSDKMVMRYFTESFSIDNEHDKDNLYFFPYIQDVVLGLIKNRSRYTKDVLLRIDKHNRMVLDRFNDIIAKEIEVAKQKLYRYSDELLYKIATNYCYVSKTGFVVRLTAHETNISFSAAAIHLDVTSKNDELQKLIDSINDSYASIVKLGGK